MKYFLQSPDLSFMLNKTIIIDKNAICEDLFCVFEFIQKQLKISHFHRSEWCEQSGANGKTFLKDVRPRYLNGRCVSCALFEINE